MGLSSLEIQNNKTEYINLLRSTNRAGIEDLIAWLENNTDFFSAPSTNCYHSAFDGGLCMHSLNVYKTLKKLIAVAKEIALPEKHIDDITEDSIIIVALLHDICKTNFYFKEVKTWKDETYPYGNQWRHYYGYKCVDNIPLGHGEKSMYLAMNFIKLTIVEALAIRWHIGMSDPSTAISYYEKPALWKSDNECPLVVLLQEADHFATYLAENETDMKIVNAID